jgi:hypothetical protein
MTQANSNPNAPVSAQSGTAAGEPLASLFKMSTTAGLGSQEYVAVNVTAIVAALFGAGSILAQLGDILLVIPIMGVILGILALKQIRNSNGTQTGRWLAWVGLILSGVFTLYLFGSRAVAAIQTRSDAQAISSLCTQFGQLLKDEKYADAYDLFDADFKTRVPADAFKGRLWAMQHSGVLPPVVGLVWNGNVEFDTKPNGTTYGHAVARVEFKNSPTEDRYGMHFRKTRSGTWEIDNIPTVFQPSGSTAP